MLKCCIFPSRDSQKYYSHIINIYFLDKCGNKDKSCDAFGQKGDKDIFCSIPWSVLNCPRICDKNCGIPLLGRGKQMNMKYA